jgi:hypothetical protein
VASDRPRSCASVKVGRGKTGAFGSCGFTGGGGWTGCGAVTVGGCGCARGGACGGDFDGSGVLGTPGWARVWGGKVGVGTD